MGGWGENLLGARRASSLHDGGTGLDALHLHVTYDGARTSVEVIADDHTNGQWAHSYMERPYFVPAAKMRRVAGEIVGAWMEPGIWEEGGQAFEDLLSQL